MIHLQSQYPCALEKAVEYLKSDLLSQVVSRIKSMSEDELVGLHFGIGTTVRSTLGLSAGDNPAYMEGCGCSNPDDASGFIIWSLWKVLQIDG